MVEQVDIVGVGTLDEWASDKTAKKILEAIRSQGAADKVYAKESAANLEAVYSEVADLRKSNKAAEIKADKEVREDARKYKKEKKSDGFLSETLQSLKGIPGIGPTLDRLGKSTASLTEIMIKSTIALLTVSGARMITQLDAARKLSERGIVLQAENVEGIAAAGIAAGNMLMTVSALEKMSEKYGATLRLYDVVKVSKAVASMSKYLTDYGVTTLETSELMADYLETQRHLGYVEKLDKRESRRAMKDAMDDTVKWSETLGKSRKEIQETSSKLLKESFVASWFRNSAQASEGVKRFATVITKALGTIEGGDKAASDLMTLLASEVPIANKMVKELFEYGLGGAANIMMKIRDTLRNEGDPTSLLIELADALSGTNLSVANLRHSIDGSAGGILTMGIALNKYADMLRADPELYEEQKKQRKAATEMANTWLKMKTIFDQAITAVFSDPKVIGYIAKTIKDLGSIIETSGGIISKFVTDFARMGVRLVRGIIWLMDVSSDVASVFNDVGSGMGRLGDNMGTTIAGVLLGLGTFTLAVNSAALYLKGMVIEGALGLAGAAGFGVAGGAKSFANKWVVGLLKTGGIIGIVIAAAAAFFGLVYFGGKSFGWWGKNDDSGSKKSGDTKISRRQPTFMQDTYGTTTIPAAIIRDNISKQKTLERVTTKVVTESPQVAAEVIKMGNTVQSLLDDIKTGNRKNNKIVQEMSDRVLTSGRNQVEATRESGYQRDKFGPALKSAV